jgi:hypothetical protein
VSCSEDLNFHHEFAFHQVLLYMGGRDSSVGIATGYGLDSPGIESWWGHDFSHSQTGPGANPAFCTMGNRSFPGVKWPGLGADHPSF